VIFFILFRFVRCKGNWLVVLKRPRFQSQKYGMPSYNRKLYIAMYACAELFYVLTNVSNKLVFRRFPLRGGSSSTALRAPLVRPMTPMQCSTRLC